jgi:D-alanine-D-alanine ligase
MGKHVAVLMGGWSKEREVSLVTGQECAAGLRMGGYEVAEIDVDRGIAQTLSALRPDVCFNALHGRFGEDGNIQGLLNLLGIPYTHSGVLASATAMHKPRAKALFSKAGLSCPEGVVMEIETLAHQQPFRPPFVVKPINEGSSVGVTIVREGNNDLPQGRDWSHGHEALVERFIPGRELTVAVFYGTAHCVTEITSSRGFYDYDAKYADGGSIHLLPADLPAAITDKALRWAETAHCLLGCRGVSRADFRYDDSTAGDGDLYLLEVNTQPGLTPTSLVPEQALYMGISFPELVANMVEDAQCDS